METGADLLGFSGGVLLPREAYPVSTFSGACHPSLLNPLSRP